MDSKNVAVPFVQTIILNILFVCGISEQNINTIILLFIFNVFWNSFFLFIGFLHKGYIRPSKLLSPPYEEQNGFAVFLLGLFIVFGCFILLFLILPNLNLSEFFSNLAIQMLVLYYINQAINQFSFVSKTDSIQKALDISKMQILSSILPFLLWFFIFMLSAGLNAYLVLNLSYESSYPIIVLILCKFLSDLFVAYFRK